MKKVTLTYSVLSFEEKHQVRNGRSRSSHTRRWDVCGNFAIYHVIHHDHSLFFSVFSSFPFHYTLLPRFCLKAHHHEVASTHLSLQSLPSNTSCLATPLGSAFPRSIDTAPKGAYCPYAGRPTLSNHTTQTMQN